MPFAESEIGARQALDDAYEQGIVLWVFTPIIGLGPSERGIRVAIGPTGQNLRDTESPLAFFIKDFIGIVLPRDRRLPNFPSKASFPNADHISGTPESGHDAPERVGPVHRPNRIQVGPISFFDDIRSLHDANKIWGRDFGWIFGVGTLGRV